MSKIINARCPLSDECERKKCAFIGHELDCIYYETNAGASGIPDQEEIRDTRERERTRAMENEIMDAMKEEEGKMSEAITVPMSAQRDIQTVTTEIRTLYEQGVKVELAYAVEIGRRLTEAKEMVPHGEWGTWIKEELPFGRSKASYLMRIFEEYGADQSSLFGSVKCQALGNLSATQALLLLDIPEEEREEFARENHVENLSTRQLQQLIRERDEARAAAEEAEKKAEQEHAEKVEWQKKGMNALADHEGELSALKEQLEAAEEEARAQSEKMDRLEAEAAEARRELEEARQEAARPVEVVIPEDKLAEIKEEVRAEAMATAEGQAKSAAEESQKKVEAAESKAKEADDAAKVAEEKARAAEEQLAALKKQIALADTHMAVFKERFAQVQRDLNDLRGAFEAIDDEEAREKLTKAVQAVLEMAGKTWR